MAAMYGVQVNNRYNVFSEGGEDDDPNEAIKRAEQIVPQVETEEKKLQKNVKAEKKQSKKAADVQQEKRPKTSDNKAERNADGPHEEKSRKQHDTEKKGENRPQKPIRGSTRSNFAGRGNQHNRRQNTESIRSSDQTEYVVGEKSINDSDSHPRSKRGGGRGKFYNKEPGKRVYDRHSGSDKTGIKHQDKRQGGGQYNWGSEHDEIEVGVNKSELNNSNQTESQDEGVPKEKDETKNETTEPAEPQAKEMTLEEYKKEQLKGRKTINKEFKIRRAGEGVDNTQWKNLVALEREGKENDGEMDPNDIEEDTSNKPKKQLNIEINYRRDDRRDDRRNNKPRDHPQRGGMKNTNVRGMGSGRGQRRAVNQFVKAPNVENKDDFPELPKFSDPVKAH